MVIEPKINMCKIKYSILENLIDENITEGSFMNVYINLDAILNSFYEDQTLEAIRDLRNEQTIALSSELINVIAHYRHFFYSRYNASSKFFLYYSRKCPELNKKLLPTYGEHMYHMKSLENVRFKTLNEYVMSNLNLLKIVIQFIHDCYYIEPSDNIDYSLIPYHFIKEEKNKDACHLILTKDKYEYQLINTSNNVHVLRLNYDKTMIVNKNNLYEYLTKKNKIEIVDNLSTELYTLILAMTGIKSRSIDGIKGFGIAASLKLLMKAIDKSLIINDYNSDIEYIANIMSKDDDNINKIITNFKAIDLRYQYKYISQADKIKMKDYIINRYNNKSLMELNEKYYFNNPLKLIELNEGIDVIG